MSIQPAAAPPTDVERERFRIAAVWFAWSVLGWAGIQLGRRYLREPAIDWLSARGRPVSLTQVALAVVVALAVWYAPPIAYTLWLWRRRAGHGPRAG